MIHRFAFYCMIHFLPCQEASSIAPLRLGMSGESGTKRPLEGSAQKKSRPDGRDFCRTVTDYTSWIMAISGRHLVVAGFISFTPAQARGFTHSAAPPLPRKALGLSRGPLFAGFISFAPAQARGFTHSAAPPLPRKALWAFPGAPFCPPRWRKKSPAQMGGTFVVL